MESTRRDRKKGVLMNTPTLTWVYKRTFKEKGIEEICDSIRLSISVGSSLKQDAVYLNQKSKMAYEKYLQKQQVRTS
jgi:hypothetical protein